MSEQMLSKSGYPLHVNGWELEDNETMCYWKEEPKGTFHFILIYLYFWTIIEISVKREKVIVL
jgi:hypothetical protein